jgi:hypothetical protein
MTAGFLTIVLGVWALGQYNGLKRQQIPLWDVSGISPGRIVADFWRWSQRSKHSAIILGWTLAAKPLWEASSSLLRATDARGLFKARTATGITPMMKAMTQIWWQKQWRQSRAIHWTQQSVATQWVKHDDLTKTPAINHVFTFYIEKNSFDNDEGWWIVDCLQQSKNNGKLPCLQCGRQIGIQFLAMVFPPYRRILQSRKICSSREWEFFVLFSFNRQTKH